jgi:RNA recognition motif-containing protein
MPQGEAKLFIGQIHFEATEEDIADLFSFYGEVRHINILRDKTHKSTGSAFVTFATTEEADAAILALHGKYYMERDKALQVSYCKKTQAISNFGYNHALEVSHSNKSNPTPRVATY